MHKTTNVKYIRKLAATTECTSILYTKKKPHSHTNTHTSAVWIFQSRMRQINREKAQQSCRVSCDWHHDSVWQWCDEIHTTLGFAACECNWTKESKFRCFF